jgi:predicted Zn-dependent protease
MAETVPPPPIGPSGSPISILRYVVLVLVVLLGLVVWFELRLVNSNAGREAAQRIRSSARVRAEFGDDVHIPLALGWGAGSDAVVYAFVTGKQTHGYAIVNLGPFGGPWTISALEVHDQSEGYLIDLAKPGPPAKPEQLQKAGSLYLVALGDAASDDVSELAGFLEKEVGIRVKTLSPISLPQEAYDGRRKEWVAEMLVQAMEAQYPDIEADPDARIVGVLEDDLYIRGFNWNFTYSYREGNKDSVIATVRLDPAFDHFPPNESIRMERLRKVAMKQVGLLYLGFEESSNPQSVDAIEGSIDDIDRMGTVFLASDVAHRSNSPDTEGSPCLTFSSANVAGLPLQKPISPCFEAADDGGNTQYQVDLARGTFQLVRTDLYRGGPVPLLLQRSSYSYRFDDKVRAFGKNSWQNLDDTVWSADPTSMLTINVYGTEFQRITPGSGFSATAKYRAGRTSSSFSYAVLSWEQTGGWRIDTRAGEVWKYLGCGPDTRVQCYYIGHSDLAGDAIEVSRVPGVGHIERVSQKTNPNLPVAAARDHTWTPFYDGDKITEIDDSDGRKAHYRYDEQDYLTDVEADGHNVHYDYDNAHRVTRVVEDGRSLGIHYDSEGRPDRVEFPNSSAYIIRYSGEAIEISGPSGRYAITVLPSFYRTIEQK